MSSALEDSYGGYALSLSERLAVRGSLAKIALDSQVANVAFWGKIHGSGNDYLIIAATVTTSEIARQFYYSNDGGVTFAVLPEPDDYVIAHASAPTCTGMFTGSPENVYRRPGEPEPEMSESEEEEESGDDSEYDEDDPDRPPRVKKPKDRKFYELDRLAYAVTRITRDTCLVARGEYYITCTRDICRDAAFAGLSIADCGQLSSYLLYRNPESENTLARVRKHGVANNADFLDHITDGQPDNVWSCVADASGRAHTLRNLVWPGYEYHVTAHAGGGVGAYFGNGLQNKDVMFML